MGGALSFEANAESITNPGQKSVLSSTIDGASPANLLSAMHGHVKDGGTKVGREAEFNVEETDGDLTVRQLFNIPEMFGGGEINLIHVWKFDHQANSCKSSVYNSKFSFESGDPACTNYCHILSDPVRIEYWQEAHEIRSSGPMMKAMMDKVLSEMGTSAKAAKDEKSPGDGAKLSVVSSPIEDVTVTPDSYWEYFREFLVEKMQATELPDGTVIEERSAVLDVLGLGAKSFAKHVFKKDEDRLECFEYGTDESLTDLISITHVQVHRNPFRLEQWNLQCPGRRAGQPILNVVQPFMEQVLKKMEESK